MPSFLDYSKIVILGVVSTIILRSVETYFVWPYYSLHPFLVYSELWGLLLDMFSFSIVLLLAFPVYYLLHRISTKLANTLFVLFILLFTVVDFLIINYFAYQLIPLDISLYNYSWQEIVFTLQTSSVNILWRIFMLSIITITLVYVFRYLKDISFSKRSLYILYALCLLNETLFVTVQLSGIIEYDSFSMNKSKYFYTQSLTYFLQDNTDHYTKEDALAYQKMHPEHSYVSTEYPLLHPFENNNVLDPYFNKFDRAPNIVVLVVEGLNDDFIHSYKGVDIMPFLSTLKNESLYWNKCFTLGERSFAVVPSLTGSLPYGKIGFMQLDRYPNHLSLVSVLKANHYHTTFFYGQGKWFHNKGKFFEFNDADLIIDNLNFGEKYKKIVVGTDHFFWGYHDKDLFNQSLEIIDTLQNQKRLDVYFTGTSHSPYIIDDTAYYENKFAQLVKKIPLNADVSFFNTYKKYILTELFVDDALSAFMTNYKKRKDYENTIFIITGDHPMTELPRANALKRYHVPLIIYSPRLKQAKTFTQTASHLDVYETLLSLLSFYQVKVPATSSALGHTLNTSSKKREERIAFMNDNREIVDYLSNDYFLSGQQLYKINDDLSLVKSTDKFRETELRKELAVFKRINLQVTDKNRILSDSLYCSSLNHTLLNSQQFDTLAIEEENKEMLKLPISNEDHVFEVSFAYEGEGDKDLRLIYEVATANGTMLIWQSCATTNDNKKLQYRIKIPKQTKGDAKLMFKISLYNANKRKCTLHDFRIMVYKP